MDAHRPPIHYRTACHILYAADPATGNPDFATIRCSDLHEYLDRMAAVGCTLSVVAQRDYRLVALGKYGSAVYYGTERYSEARAAGRKHRDTPRDVLHILVARRGAPLPRTAGDVLMLVGGDEQLAVLGLRAGQYLATSIKLAVG